MKFAAPLSIRLVVAVLCAVAWGVATADVHAQTRRQPTGADRAQIQKLSGLVNRVARGQISSPSDVGLFWTHHFLRAPNDLVFVPYEISLDGEFQSDTVIMYVRAVSRDARSGEFDQSAMTMGQWRNQTERPGVAGGNFKDIRAASPKDPYAFEDAAVFEGPVRDRLTRTLWVPSGEYDIYIALQEREGGGKTAVLSEFLQVPDLSTEFSVSSVIIADGLEPDPESGDGAPERDHAFSVGGLQVAPLHGSVLDPGRTLDIVFWIYNESLGADGKPDLEVDYSFYRKIGPTDVFFNRTRPKLFTAETVPVDFDLSEGHQILATQSVPLGSFPDGDYRLTIRVFDNVSARLILRDVDFSVLSM